MPPLEMDQKRNECTDNTSRTEVKKVIYILDKWTAGVKRSIFHVSNHISRGRPAPLHAVKEAFLCNIENNKWKSITFTARDYMHIVQRHFTLLQRTKSSGVIQ